MPKCCRRESHARRRGRARCRRQQSRKEEKPMKEKEITFKSLEIDPCYAFLCTDEEIEATERKEAERAADIERVFFAPGFIAAEYTQKSGAREILHHSTRNGVFFQLSYIATDGVPTMHENFIRIEHKNPVDQAIHEKAELLRHFVNLNLEKSITFKVLTA